MLYCKSIFSVYLSLFISSAIYILECFDIALYYSFISSDTLINDGNPKKKTPGLNV